MICVICGQAETVYGHTSIRFERGEFRILVKSVPARICPSCKEAYVEEIVANELLQIARQTSESGLLDTQCEYGVL